MIFTKFPGSFCCLGARGYRISCCCMYGSLSHRINVLVLTPAAAASSDLYIAFIFYLCLFPAIACGVSVHFARIGCGAQHDHHGTISRELSDDTLGGYQVRL